jgi:hypothetical protein
MPLARGYCETALKGPYYPSHRLTLGSRPHALSALFGVHHLNATNLPLKILFYENQHVLLLDIQDFVTMSQFS